MHRIIKYFIKFRVLLLLAFLCSCKSQITPQPLPPQSEGARYLLLLIHGSGDTAGDWPADVLRQIEKTILHREQWDLVAYDWSSYAEDKGSASKEGLEIGRGREGMRFDSALLAPLYERIEFTRLH
ncbi:MAG: hypothetical protein WCQ99_15125, partial [Pseudomonadota bacterium]